MGDNFSISKWNKERFLKEDISPSNISPKIYFEIWEFLMEKVGIPFTKKFPTASDFYFKIENHLSDIGVLNEVLDKKFKVEYWYQYMDDYDFDIVDVEAPNEEEAIEKAKKMAPKRAKNFKIIN